MTATEDKQYILKLFEPPTMCMEVPGYLDVENQIRHIITGMIQKSRKDRFMIAAEMSRAMDREVTHHMLNAYTSAKEGNKFPLSFLPAFEQACGSYDLLEFIATKRGCGLLIGNETEAANMGRIKMLKDELNREEEKILKRMERNHRLLEMSRED